MLLSNNKVSWSLTLVSRVETYHLHRRFRISIVCFCTMMLILLAILTGFILVSNVKSQEGINWRLWIMVRLAGPSIMGSAFALLRVRRDGREEERIYTVLRIQKFMRVNTIFIILTLFHLSMSLVLKMRKFSSPIIYRLPILNYARIWMKWRSSNCHIFTENWLVGL